MLQFCNDFKKVATVMTQPVATPNNQTVCTESTIDQLAIETGMVVVRLIELHGLHEVHVHSIYLEYHSVCPLVGIGTLPLPLSIASVPLPLEPKGGGQPACG
jgi:hypothetical protein